jgi:type IV pilus assembly protein PilB
MTEDNGLSIEDLLNSKALQEKDSPAAQLTRRQSELRYQAIEDQTAAQAGVLGLAYINLIDFPISPEAIVLLDQSEAEALQAICFYYEGRNVRIGTIEPSDQLTARVSELENKLHVKIKIYLISQRSLEYGRKVYDALPKIQRMEGVEISPQDLIRYQAELTDAQSLDNQMKKANISQILSLVIASALKMGSSDVHIEAEEKSVAIRMRVDGLLQQVTTIPKQQWKKVISRLKVVARVKLNVEDKPQDGRFDIFLPEEKIAVRTSFLPTAYGESVVLRLLRPDSAILPLDGLGMRPEVQAILEKEMTKPNGLILTTGPTGSGKTTTLYAALNQLNSPGVKIITLEDPIEYELKGINQSQVDEGRGHTFANGLKSILRQDPNIVMIGEIRDLDTAEIAIQASLTGHLVFSTLHTNDAAGVLPRLLDLGVQPYQLAPAINAIIGQRLVRRLCPHCRQVHQPSETEQEQINKILAVVSPKAGVDVPKELPTFYKVGAGCEHCAGFGYKGRVGLYEIFIMSESMKTLINEGAPSFKVMRQAIEDGMITMLQDGILKMLDGQTSLEEVLRVIGKTDYIDDLYDIVVSQTLGRGLKISADDLVFGETIAQDIKAADQTLTKKPTSQMLAAVMAGAIAGKAADVHIDPIEGGVKIRYRLDGILHDIVTLGAEHYVPLIGEIKNLIGLSLSVKQPTFDGRFSMTLPSERMDCRVSLITGGYGETVVIRLLSNQAISLELTDLGIRDKSLAMIDKSIHKTKGIIITTGPTGSGKTTTLYALLKKLNTPEIKIITIEDPIEYHLDGVMQTQIDTAGGYTFAAALRSLMRQNPNVILVGEIRDPETAKTAIEASLTGHLVLSTIHANSAAGAIARFAGLGVERPMLASALECSIGQRLVRRLCPNCKKPAEPKAEIWSQAEKIWIELKANQELNLPDKPQFYEPVGCSQCRGVGYKGRVGIYEVIIMTPEIQKLIQQPLTTDAEIEQLAIEQGSLLMTHDGLVKAANGETSLEEIWRVAS